MNVNDMTVFSGMHGSFGAMNVKIVTRPGPPGNHLWANMHTKRKWPFRNFKDDLAVVLIEIFRSDGDDDDDVQYHPLP